MVSRASGKDLIVDVWPTPRGPWPKAAKQHPPNRLPTARKYAGRKLGLKGLGFTQLQVVIDRLVTANVCSASSKCPSHWEVLDKY